MDAQTRLTSEPAVDLARRADLTIGATVIRPSRRLVETPAGSAVLEPKVMQVLLVLLDARGGVVTREDLIAACWGGRFVGLDSINRAIAELRRGLRSAAAEVAVETVAKVGYRAVAEGLGEAPTKIEDAAPESALSAVALLSRRRLLIAGGALGLAGLGAGAGIRLLSGASSRSAAGIAEARRTLHLAMPGAGGQARAALGPALAEDGDNPAVLGALALAHAYDVKNGPPAGTSRALLAAERAARHALERDPRQADALAALAVLRPFLGDWRGVERRLQAVLAVDPDHLTALGELSLLYQSCGLCRRSLELNTRALAIDPVSPMLQYRQAMKHWVFGQQARSDLTIDRALQLWPQHPAVWNARMMLFTFTDRPQGARALLADTSVRRDWLRPGQRGLWDTVLRAIEQPAGAARAQAIALGRRAVAIGPGPAALLTMVMSHLGEIDHAFALAEAYLLRRGPLVPTLSGTREEVPISDIRWRETINLFTPATAAMRADPRFEALCDGLGMVEYWRTAGVTPDHKRGLI